MKKLVLLIAAIIQLTLGYCQEINYQKSYSDALALAEKSQKPVFLLLTVPVRIPPDSLHKFANFTSGLNTKAVADLYNKKFISYKVNVSDSGAAKIRALYNPIIFPCYVFLNAKGKIIYKYGGNYEAPEKYLDMAKQAIANIASGNTMSNYEQLDKEGKITREQLKKYITLRQSFDLFDNAALIDKYVGLLTVNELDDYQQVLFILKAAPYAYGKTYNLARTNPKIHDSIYKHEPLELREQINSHIIVNTLNEAIKTKNIILAQNVANFVRGAWGKDYQAAEKNSENEMLIYYKGIKDTTRYYQQASYFYDSYYLNISADSAKKLQANALEKAKAHLKPADMHPPVKIKSPENNRVTITRTIAVPQSLEVANTLNSAAWNFYLLGTHNTTYLVKALVWCHRAIDLNPVFSYYDTMAHLMYRLKFYDEAELNQQKAIEMAANAPMLPQQEVDHLKAELDKMKGRKL